MAFRASSSVVAALLLAASAALWGCSGAGAKCSAQSCTGCCKGDTCVAGTADDSCGKRGAACSDCTSSGNHCFGKTCAPSCAPVGIACDPSTPCCVGLSCSAGSCVDSSCAVADAPCGAGTVCCLDLVCDAFSSTCVAPPTCGTMGAACSAAVPCCTGWTCDAASGTCVAPNCVKTGGACSATAPCCLATDQCGASNPVCVDSASCLGSRATCVSHKDCCSGYCHTNKQCALSPPGVKGASCINMFDCASGLVCLNGFCGGANCGGIADACPASTCCTGLTCSATGSCSAGAPLVFTSAFQTLPNTGTDVIEFRCAVAGSIFKAGLHCELAAGDPIELRINGTLYKLYGGCTTGTVATMCQAMAVGTAFKDQGNLAPARLLCEAMGYNPANTLTNNAVVTVAARAAAVVQNYPLAYGTSAGYANAFTFVECSP